MIRRALALLPAALLFAAALSPARAAQDAGLRLRLEGAALFFAGTDRLDPEVEPATVDSLEERGKLDRRLEVVPVFDVSYRTPRAEVYARTPYRSPALPVAVGAAAALPGGSVVDLSLESELFARVWSDPYLVGTPRSDTRLWNATARAGWRGAPDLPLAAGVWFGVEHPEKDELGAREPTLERKGRKGGVWLGSGFSPTPGGRLTGQAGYERGDLHGDAASWNGYRAAVAWSKRESRFAFDASLDAVWRTYGAADPVFNKRREEGEFSLTGFWAWDSILGHKPLFADLLAGVRYRDANIDFLDARTFVLGVGAGLRF